MKKIILILIGLIFFVSLANAEWTPAQGTMNLRDRYSIINGLTINSTNFCIGTDCITSWRDTNASTQCSGNQVPLGNGSCVSDTIYITSAIEIDPIFLVENASLWAEAQDKYNSTYDSYADNVSTNYTLDSYNNWGSNWYNHTLAVFTNWGSFFYNQTQPAIDWVLTQGYIPNTNVVFDNESMLNETYVRHELINESYAINTTFADNYDLYNYNMTVGFVEFQYNQTVGFAEFQYNMTTGAEVYAKEYADSIVITSTELNNSYGLNTTFSQYDDFNYNMSIGLLEFQYNMTDGAIIYTDEQLLNYPTSTEINSSYALNITLEQYIDWVQGNLTYVKEDAINNSYPQLTATNIFTNINHFTSNVSMADNLTVGNNVLYVDSSSGRVGIGTSSPFFPLVVSGEDNANVIDSLELNNKATGVGSGTKILFTRFTDGAAIRELASIEGVFDGSNFGHMSFNVLNSGTETALEMMRINENGNVGIGTPGPTHLLNVDGTANITGDALFESDVNVDADLNVGSGGYSSGGVTLYGTGSNKGSGYFASDVLIDGELITITGQTVNGSMNPITDNTYNLGNVTNRWANVYVNKAFLNDWTNLTGTNVTLSDSLAVTNDLDVGSGTLFVNSGGNVGIGTTSPTTAKLDIESNAYYGVRVTDGINAGGSIGLMTTSAAPNVGYLLHNNYFNGVSWLANDNTTGSNQISFTELGNIQLKGQAGGEGEPDIHMTILAGGNVGIGTTSPTSKLHVQNGDGNFSGTVYINNAIDLSNTISSTQINASYATNTTFADNYDLYNYNQTVGYAEFQYNMTTGAEVYTDEVAVAQDECSEITGCVEDALTNTTTVDCSIISGTADDVCVDIDTDTQDLSYDAPTDVISLTDGGTIDISEVDTDTTYTAIGNLSLVGTEFDIDFTELLPWLQSLFYDSEADLTGLLDDNYQATGDYPTSTEINASYAQTDISETFTKNLTVSDSLAVTNDLDVGSGTLFVDGGGNVGIGDTTPTSKLHIQDGDVNFSDGTAGGFFYQDSTKNVGIGTSSLATQYSGWNVLQIGNAGIIFADVNPTVGGMALMHNAYYSGGYKRIGVAAAEEIEMTLGDINFKVAVTGAADSLITWVPAITIKNDGKVGIGTTSPTHKLNVIGDANITQSLFVDGENVTDDVFVPQYIFSHTNESQTIIQNVWTNVSFDHEVDLLKRGITHTFNDVTNDTFTIGSTGVYFIDYNYDIVDSAANPGADVAARVLVNNVEVPGSVFETDTSKQSAEIELSHETLGTLNAGDILKFQIISDDATVSIETHGTFGDDPDSASIIIEKISR